MRHEIDGAASLGAELFVLDAGWYAEAGAAAAPTSRPGSARGRSTRDDSPTGSGASPTTPTAAGMKFGIWVEPETRRAVDGRPSGTGPGSVAREGRRQVRLQRRPRRSVSATPRRGTGSSTSSCDSSTRSGPTTSSGTTTSGSTAIGRGTCTARRTATSRTSAACTRFCRIFGSAIPIC